MSETTTLTPLQRAFLALEQSRARVADLEAAAREPIAVIGMGCRVPGGGHDPASFWRLVRDEVDAIGPIPAERWDIEALYDPDPDAAGRIATRQGGFLRDPVDRFDAAAFGIAPREAAGMDPQQRLLLEVCWEALEHAGLAPDRLERSATGVYIGAGSGDYIYLQMRSGDRGLLDAHFASGIAHSVFSGRLSYLLGLQGPSITVDTACSSSLVSVHLACQALRSGDCRMALAGGVNLMLAPDLYIALSRSRMLAPDGRCKTFAASADGFGRAEGCGVVVLKRLRDARADGDRVLAVIRGTAVNQDGPSSSLTAPNGPAQEAVIRAALANGGVDPASVGYVEAHGTGTELGDPLEVRALGEVFGPGRDPARPLLIGSVKTNIGHLEAAAGVVGLIKVVLSLREGTIPAHLHFREPSPHIPWSEYPLEVPAKARAWPVLAGTRIGGVSSFGFSGTNAHVVVEEAPATALPAAGPSPCLFTLSAHDERALAELATRCADAFAAHPEEDLADLCDTANTGRAHLAVRATVLASTLGELRERLAALGRGEAPPGVRTARVGRRDPPRVAFLFTGQGSQRAGMARRLHETVPAFRAALDRCAAILGDRLGVPLAELLFDEGADAARLDETAFTQPALFAVEYALAETWRAWGVAPQAAMGHSVGEFVAACQAGVLTLEDALAMVAERGRLMQSLPAGGAMAAILAPEPEVAAAIAGDALAVSIAAINGPGQTVISGRADAVRRHAEAFAARGVQVRPLAVSHAFHSPLVEPVLDAFERDVASRRFGTPRLRIVSNLTGRLATAEELARPTYWRRHMREAVRFADGLQALAALKPDILLEVGPHPTLVAFAQAMPEASGMAMVGSMRKGRDDREALLDALAQLHLAGAPIDWRAVAGDRPRRVLDLPTYPFQRERHWFRAAPAPEPARGRPTGHPLLGSRLRLAGPDRVFEGLLGARSPAFVHEHRVLGRVVMPATAYLEMFAGAARDLLPGEAASIEDVVVREAMLLEEDGAPRRVQVTARTHADGGLELGISSQPVEAGDEAPWVEHASAVARRAAAPAAPLSLEALETRCATPIAPEAFYAGFERRGLDFGPAFRGLRTIRRGAAEALGEVELADALRGEAGYRFHPVLLDGCLQVLAAALEGEAADDALFLPIGIGRYALHGVPGPRCVSHVTLQAGGSEVRRADILVLDPSGALVAELRDVQLKRVARDALERLGRRDLDEDLYETTWPLEPPAPRDAAPDWDPALLAATAARSLEALRESAGIADYDRYLPRCDAVCADFTLRALRELGWKPSTGERVAAEALAASLGVVPRQRRLFQRLLAILGEEGLLAAEGDGWRVARELRDGGDPRSVVAELTARHPDAAPELEMIGRVGGELAGALRGDREPMQLLFPDGSIEAAERMYRDTPTARFYNGLIAEALAAALAAVPAGRPLRILEVGGGTGGTTAHLVPRLPREGVEYTFTDVGPLFVARARERFGPRHAGMSFATLDLERDPGTQGFAGRAFDIVFASNVIHATADLRRTLARVRGMLAPGGLLVMLEVTAPQRWFDLTVGITEGWWAFTDRDLRRDYATLPRERWLGLLGECGFDACAALPGGGGLSGILALQSLFVARASREAGREWLLVADQGGLVAALAERLRARGDRCRVVQAGDDYAAALAQQAAQVVVHGASLDTQPADAMDGETLQAAQRRGVLDALRLAQALLARPSPPRLVLLTRGVQCITDEERAFVAAQAPLAGLAKALVLEHPELHAQCVDLEPGGFDGELEALLAQLDSPPGETLVGVRADGRHVARLTRLARAPQDGAGAWRLRPAASGSLERFERVALERRAPGAGEVEIAVEATGLNFKDVLNALGMYPGDPGPLGGECAGRVVAVGAGVDGLRVGDAVLAMAGGSFASHVVARAAWVRPLPTGASFEDGATFGIAYVTAEFCLGHLGRLAAGERVLVHAAAGGVGLAAVRLALRAGAEVFATAGSPAKRELLARMGVAHVLDSRSPDFAAAIRERTGGRGVDVVLNSLAGEMLEASFAVLRDGGRFLEIGKRDIKSAAEVEAMGRGLEYHVVDWGETGERDPDLIGGLLGRLVDEWRDGRLQPLPRHAFGLDQAQRAFRFMAQARHVGRIAVRHGAATTPAVRRDGTYLVTGGLTGLGLEVARRFAARGAGRLLLAGRRAPGPEAVRAVEALRAAGTAVEVLRLDVADAAAVDAALAQARASGPALRGVVHGAGALSDAALLHQDENRFARVFAAKLAGTLALDAATRGDPLDFFVMFSSVAAVLGSAGQANHSAANAYLGAFAHERAARGQPALAIDWGAWSEVGAAAGADVAGRLAAQGIAAFAPERGLALMERLMDVGARQAAAIAVDWPRYLALRPGEPFFSRLSGPARAMAATASATSPAADDFRSRVAQAPAGRQRALVAAFLHEKAARALGLDPTRNIDPKRPLGELGLDSLLAVELRNALGTALGKSLPATLMFDYPTLESLGDYVHGEVLGLAPRPAQPAAPEPARGALVDSIEDLSDEEVDRLLAQRARQGA